MITFREFLDENKKQFDAFIKDQGLDDEWKEFKSKPKTILAPPGEAKGWKLDPQEIMRDIKGIITTAVSETHKKNNFGIDNIDFEIIQTHETAHGLKIDLEAYGCTHARNTQHIKRQLERINNNAKKRLSEKGIRLDFMYNRIDTNEAKEDVKETSIDNPPIGLVRKLEFRVIAVATANSKQHKTPQN